MADGFQVDLSALQRASSGVDATLDEVGKESVRSIAAHGTRFGHDRLTQALNTFADKWDSGVQNLAKDGREVAERLRHSVQTYQRVEQGVAGMLRGSGPDPAAR